MHPQAEQVRHFCWGGDLEVYLVVLDRLLRATTKKRSSTFLRKKCTPDKILATPVSIRKWSALEGNLVIIRLLLLFTNKNYRKWHCGLSIGSKLCDRE